ncbi:Transcriptional regulator, TetR family [Roseibacterium elongatum DSM 19469]|uniref:Transcriptional regulator, TetR family n=2 Tax=Roseicyclus elongatus TaxID=159346 RepID=W8RWL6_9RHOB|nr:Transcriptional regulator, TetR family [Roseibacterium elongatum DSM 19469]
MPAGEAPYHHGDLRARLVEIAIDCIETDGVSKLSLRKMAAKAGVSHNAPYMHFPSKDALLDEVVTQGFARLRSRISDAGGRETMAKGDWADRVKSGFRAYVAFARDHPGLYALMHVPGSGQGAQDRPEAEAADADAPGTATLRGLAATLEVGQKLGRVRAGNTNEMALWVWATLHGIASLTSDDRAAFEGRSPEAVAETVLDCLIAALTGELRGGTGLT